ncbi:hypothetical protein EPA93_44345 [Ktedonosporobacter rubrisoli]|uniref:Uncharacterized protein n=1 Tax=Ktedonosporobacter rubrisoli TaxID=2509675 RepID=A0A4P6K519_KTERU|nr:hypothetical protein [Ktedonosporobacter rubrisoli]QBD82626.1 hypothetical protein EPA93_44345 [Ktedonosporobacter rubrisoli]
MEVHQELCIPIKDHEREREARALFQFFVDAEQHGQHFTYNTIRKRFPYSRSTISKYARNFWSWFLRNEEQVRGKPFTFSCQGLIGYPVDYFILAHQRNQGKYFWQFAKAMKDAEERTERAGSAKQQAAAAMPQTPPLVFTSDVPGQELPEEPHIEVIQDEEEGEELALGHVPQDEEEEEYKEASPLMKPVFVTESEPRERREHAHLGPFDDQQEQDEPKQEVLEVPLLLSKQKGEVGDDITTSLSAASEPPPGEPVPIATPPSALEVPSSAPSLIVTPPGPTTTMERIFEMLGFSRKNREALEQQLRLAVETLTGQLSQEREQLSREVTSALEPVKHTLEEHAQQIALLPTEVSQLRADVIGQVQAVKEQVLIVEQTLSQEQRFREQIAGNVEELIEEIRQSRTPPDFSPMVDALGSRMREIEQTLTEIIKQSSTPPDLSSIRDTLQSSSEHLQHVLLSALQKPDALPGLPQIVEALAEVQHQVSHQLPEMTVKAIDAQQRIEERLTSLMKQFADRPPVPANNGQVRAIQASIRNAKTKAQDALDTLYQECMAWLDELDHHMQKLQQGHKDSNKSIQTIQAFIAPAEEKASPDAEESQNGMAADEAQE